MKNEKLFYSNKNFNFTEGLYKKNKKKKINKNKVKLVLNRLLIMFCIISLTFLSVRAIFLLINKIQELIVVENKTILEGDPAPRTNYLEILKNKE